MNYDVIYMFATNNKLDYDELCELIRVATAPQAEPNDAKDAARYRYLVVMETKAAPDTVAHYIRNPAHLDRVIEVMEQKP